MWLLDVSLWDVLDVLRPDNAPQLCGATSLCRIALLRLHPRTSSRDAYRQRLIAKQVRTPRAMRHRFRLSSVIALVGGRKGT